MEIINKIYSFPQENLNLLRRKTFLKPLIKLMIRDELLSEVELDDDVTNQLCDTFFKRINIDSEEVCVKALKDYLKINSRKDLATNEIAQAKFKNLRKKAWDIKNDKHKDR